MADAERAFEPGIDALFSVKEHARPHALEPECQRFGCLGRFRFAVLAELTEAIENEPRPESKAALRRAYTRVSGIVVPIR